VLRKINELTNYLYILINSFAIFLERFFFCYRFRIIEGFNSVQIILREEEKKKKAD
jgi:hypothetical protein